MSKLMEDNIISLWLFLFRSHCST